MLKKKYLNSELSYKQVIKTAKKLIKRERKLLGSNHYLWHHEGFNDPFGRYKDMLTYAYKNLVETDLDYETWSQEQLKQAEADLKEKWGEERIDKNGL